MFSFALTFKKLWCTINSVIATNSSKTKNNDGYDDNNDDDDKDHVNDEDGQQK